MVVRKWFFTERNQFLMFLRERGHGYVASISAGEMALISPAWSHYVWVNDEKISTRKSSGIAVELGVTDITT